jgi:hypothetical protein
MYPGSTPAPWYDILSLQRLDEKTIDISLNRDAAPIEHIKCHFFFKKTQKTFAFLCIEKIGSVPICLSIALLGRRRDFGLRAVALIGGRRVLDPYKLTDTPTPVPRRQELIGSAGALRHTRFHQKDASGPWWQSHTAGSSLLASQPARFAIAADSRRRVLAASHHHKPACAAE